MQIKELMDMVNSGVRPIVTFNKGINEFEVYFETGMRAQLIGVRPDGNDSHVLSFSLKDFNEYNKQFETATYYDDFGVPNQTATEAGCHPGDEDSLWLHLEDDIDFMSIDANPKTMYLYDDYCKNPGGKSYVEWLEHKVLAQRVL